MEEAGRAPRERSSASGSRARLAVLAGLGLLGWGSCSVYDEGLLTGPAGGTAGTGGAVGGANGGSGDDGGTAGTAGASGGAAAAAGSSSGGKGSGGASGGVAGNGAGGASGATGGTSAGKGGSATGGALGLGGEGGEGGEGACPGGDCCPTDAAKTEPGTCGCGVADTDSDGDTTPDCLDACDDDAAKTSPGMCGCGVVEARCLPLKTSLLHRYSFDGTGTTVTDSEGTAHGTVMGTGATLSGTGTLVLAGGVPAAMDPNKQHVALPAGCLDGLVDATFEAWVDWAPADGTNLQSFWQRVFDFGETIGSGEDTYLFVTPRAMNATGPSRAAFTSSMGATNQIFSNGPTLAAGVHHFTVVVDDTNDLISLYVDGELGSSTAFPGALSAINDVNCFLGRSQYAADPYLAGTLDEFRIHSAAFTAADVTFSHASGPDPAFL